MTDSPAFHLRLVPLIHLGFALFSLGMFALSVVFAPALLKNGLAGYEVALLIVIFAGASGLTVSLVRQRWGTLTIGAEIEYRRRWGAVSLRLPREVARQVYVHRQLLRNVPTDYELHVQIGGKRFRLLFAEHWLFGERKLRLARQMAAELNVPISDPVGEARRASRFPPARWLGQGQEWKIALATLLILAATVGAAMLA